MFMAYEHHTCRDPLRGSPEAKVRALEQIALGLVTDPVAYARDALGVGITGSFRSPS